MDSISIAAASGMRSRMQSLDLLANNLANASTNGFKRDQEFYGVYSSADSENADATGPNSTLPVIQRQWTDFSTGSIQTTGNALNIALTGPGFLSVNGTSGPLYTRNGDLQILSTGELATSDGRTVRNAAGGTIRISSDQPVSIAADGTVSQGGAPRGKIQVVNFKSTDSLIKMGNTCFVNSDPKNIPADSADPRVEQGKIEGSNVPVAEAAMRLVGMMRQFEMLQKAVSVSNDMDSKTIQEVARVGS
jgi:flagellar basal body rod protein FlgG